MQKKQTKKATMARTLTKGQPEGSSVSIMDIRTIFAWPACMVIGSIPVCLFYRITGKPTPCELIAACRHVCQVKCNLYAPDNRGNCDSLEQCHYRCAVRLLS